MAHTDDPEDISSYRRRLDELTRKVHDLVPGWTPEHLDDVASNMCYVAVVEDALDHANLADLESLQSGPFFDGLNMDSDYYLEFARDPTTEEMQRFQAALFQGYLQAGSEEFDHLVLLKRTLPMIRISLL